MRGNSTPWDSRSRRTPPIATAIIGGPRRFRGSVIVIDCGDATRVAAEPMVRTAALAAEIVEEFRRAVSSTGRTLAAESLVLRLLAEAPFILDVNAAAARVVGCEARGYDAKRKTVWRVLDTEGQLPPSRLLLVLRLLWFGKLHQMSWPATEISAFLGYSSPRLFRVSIRRRCGLTMHDLNAVRYERVLAWAASVCTMIHDHTEDIFAALRAVRVAPESLLSQTGPRAAQSGARPVRGRHRL
jgi:hypothetical protein